MMPSLQPSVLRERLTLQRFTTTAVAGDPVETEETWADAGDFRARVEPLTAAEATRNGQAVSSQPHRLTYRTPSASLRPQDRVVWHHEDGDKTLHVVSVSDLNARRLVSVAVAVLSPDEA